MSKSTRTFALLLAVGMGTLGCASEPPSSPPTTPAAEDPSATPTPTLTPTPTPTEQAGPAAERIVVSAEAIVVLAADGSELAAYDYFQDTSEVVAGLTEVFGRASVDTPFEGDPHSPAGTLRAWGGFALLDDDREPVPPHTPNHLVDVTAAEVDGITIETADGYAVGAAAAAALAAPDAEPVRTDSGQAVQVEPVRLDFDDPTCPEVGCTLSVRLFTDESAELFARILAPTPNFGP